MLKGFFKGLLTGSILGLVFSNNVLVKTNKKKMGAKRIKGKSRFIQSQTKKIFKKVANTTND